MSKIQPWHLTKYMVLGWAMIGIAIALLVIMSGIFSEFQTSTQAGYTQPCPEGQVRVRTVPNGSACVSGTQIQTK